jgi:hypothetical protein
MWKTMSFLNLSKCLLVSNGVVDFIVATEIGPRILRYGLVNGPNLLGEYPNLKTETPWGTWRPWGGHRLWVAPEAMPESYAPDNGPVEVEDRGELSVSLSQPVDRTGIQKEMYIRMQADSSCLEITHKLINRTESAIRVSAWAITIMREGGTAVVPLAPFRSHDDELLPAQPVVRWYFTDWTDSRWTFGRSHLSLRGDSSSDSPQKIGTMNRQGWCGFLHGESLFIKEFPYVRNSTYPDFGCNNEVYGAGPYIELESLGPLSELQPGFACEHIERWHLLAMAKAHGPAPVVEDALYGDIERAFDTSKSAPENC